MKKKTKLTIETERVLVIRRRGARRARCAACGEAVDFVTIDEAAALQGVSASALYPRVEAGAIHFTEAAEGVLLVCLNSLRQ